MSRILAGGIQWYYELAGTCCPRILVLVHGFAQSHRTWEYTLPSLAPHFQILLVDLPGFGKTPLPEERMDLFGLGGALAEMINNITESPVSLCGYSFGGRVAFHAVLHLPSKFNRVAVIGASPGIEDEKKRGSRKGADNVLADRIRKNGAEWFADYWTAIPILASQRNLPLEIQQQLRQERLSCLPESLAFTLENFGTGTQEYLLPRLEVMDTPLLLMAGQSDTKFCHSNSQIASAVPHATAVEIPNAGHAAHVENPEAVAMEIIAFLK